MPRKATRSVNAMDKDDDMLSQNSKANDSDDRELEVYAKAVAEFKVTWQKQKREKERRFLRAAQAEMDEHVKRKRDEIDLVINEMEGLYQDFLLKYAVLEDKKREVIVKLYETQKKLVALSVRKHQETIELTQNREEGALESIKQVKKTFQEFAAIVEAFMND